MSKLIKKTNFVSFNCRIYNPHDFLSRRSFKNYVDQCNGLVESGDYFQFLWPFQNIRNLMAK